MKNTSSLPALILSHLVQNEEYIRKCIPHLNPDYFESESHKIIFESIGEYLEKYNAIPPKKALMIELSKNEILQKNEKLATSIIESLKSIYTPFEEEFSFDWLVNETEKWCQERAVYNSIITSVNILDGNDQNLSKHAIPKLLQDALSISFDTNVGHDYIENFEERFDFYQQKLDRLPFDIDILNKITQGGVPSKTLNLIAANVGVGKSLILCHFASSYLMQSKNVLYITMEMAEERIAERIDANLMGIPINALPEISSTIFTDRINSLKEKTKGRLIIKEFPTGAAHTGHFRALLNELRTKKNFIPDVVMIDYLNICSSSRIKGLGSSINTYSFVKSIAEEIRGLAIEFKIPIWSATQTTRGSANTSDVDITGVSESFGTAQTVDFMIGAISTEELQQKGQILFKQFKNRYGDPAYYGKFFVGVDRSKMKLYNLENENQSPESGENNNDMITSISDSQSSIGGKPDFRGFNFE